MASPSKDKNGADDNRVSVDRDEHRAHLALSDLHDDLLAKHARLAGAHKGLVELADAMTRRLAELDLVMQHHERVHALQRTLIDLLRGPGQKVASLEDLSEFWRQWTKSARQQPPERQAEVARLEPDLFRTWRLWVDNGSRWSVAGSVTRVQEEQAQASRTQAVVQDDKWKELAARARQLTDMAASIEAEIATLKAAKK